MPRKTISSGRPPTSRIYSSEPLPRQRRFPARERFSMPSTTPAAARAESRQKRQSTLTQLDFTCFADDLDLDDRQFEDESDIEQDDAGGSSRRKRRKLSRSAKEKDDKQQTLTQIRFVWDSDGESEPEEASDGEEDGESEKQQLALNQMENQEHQRVEQVRHGGDGDEENHCPQQDQEVVFRTPERPIRHEVPSSQSPATTPLSAQRDLPLRTSRSPLQEIPSNVLAQRDSTPTPQKKTSKHMKRRHDGGADYETDEQENSNPFSDDEVEEDFQKGIKSEDASQMPPLSFTTPRHEQQRATRQSNYTRLHSRDSSRTVTDAYFRSSQASTVDLTPNGPQLPPPLSQYESQVNTFSDRHTHVSSSAPDDSSPQPPPKYATLFDSQLPFDGVSEDDCSPLASIQDSTNILTTSQLLPGSSLTPGK